MNFRSAAIAAFSLLCAAPACQSQPAVCGACHPKEAQAYRKTGMARSFCRPEPENTLEDYTVKNSSYHKPSDTYYEMVQRAGRYYQGQYQIGFDGKRTNLLETEIDYVLGSGNHARAYLHLTARNTLVLLPLGWYAENGGYWAMNPGYDRPDNQALRRNVSYDCMFCHNAYPPTPAENGGPRAQPVFSSVPEGIDCQRCHGGGDRHIALALTGREAGRDPRRHRESVPAHSRGADGGLHAMPPRNHQFGVAGRDCAP